MLMSVLLLQDPSLLDLLQTPIVSQSRFAAKDDRGAGLDCLKIVGIGKGSYVGVYHSLQEGSFRLRLARSTDLLNWRFVRELDDHGHQGTLSRKNGRWLLAYEKDGPNGNWIRLRRYRSLSDLQRGRHEWQTDLPRTLSKYNEGTPSILSWSDEKIDLRFHFQADSLLDRQARGTWTASGWKATPVRDLNEWADKNGIGGNLGDRDLFSWGGALYAVVEGQGAKDDWASWRLYLWPFAAPSMRKVEVRTPGGSMSVANPTVSAVTLPDGRDGHVVTAFIPSQGAGPGEAGCAIWYRATSR